MYLSTDRLIIRPLTMDDISPLMDLFGDPDVMHFSLKGVKNRTQVEEFVRDCALKSYEINGFGQYAVELKSTNELVGISGFYIQEIEGKREVELGYRFIRAHWGNGYATEAAKALIDYARAVLGLHALISLVAYENTASARVCEKVGMTVLRSTTIGIFTINIYGIELFSPKEKPI